MTTEKAPVAAPGTTAEPAKPRVREEVFSKTEFVATLQERAEKELELKMSREMLWNLFKLSMATGYQLAEEKPLSLSGVGRFYVLISKRSGRRKMRFRPTSQIELHLNPELAAKKALPKTDSAKAAVPAAPTAAPSTDLL